MLFFQSYWHLLTFMCLVLLINCIFIACLCTTSHVITAFCQLRNKRIRYVMLWFVLHQQLQNQGGAKFFYALFTHERRTCDKYRCCTFQSMIDRPACQNKCSEQKKKIEEIEERAPKCNRPSLLLQLQTPTTLTVTSNNHTTITTNPR